MAAAAPKDIYEVILAFQLDPPSLLKDTSGQVGPRKYKYVDLNQVVERVVRDRLNKAKCIVTQPMDGEDLLTVIRHVPSGTQVESRVRLSGLDDPQDAGKAITYMRRYTLVSMLCLIGDEDDDAAGFTRHRGASAAPVATSASMPDGPPPAAVAGGLEL